MNAKDNLIDRVVSQVGRVVTGNKLVLEKIMYCFLSGGHVLLESVPGLAKTLTLRAFGAALGNADFRRVQMTPNLLPSDIVGNEILNFENKMEVRFGPIFTNIFLADEINRTIPKTQAALLEAMSDRTVSIGGQTYPMKPLFLVGATMNPIDQEGTYPLPEAQLDRFLFKISMGYVSKEDEIAMALNTKLRSANPLQDIQSCATVEEIVELREKIRTETYVARPAVEYIVNLVQASRPPLKGETANPVHEQFLKDAGQDGKQLANCVELGASPRAIQALKETACVRAFHCGRNFIIPEDVRHVFADVMRHRLLMKRRVKSSEYTSANAIDTLLKHIKVLEDVRAFQPRGQSAYQS